MVAFISQEAREKAREVQVKADEEFAIEKVGPHSWRFFDLFFFVFAFSSLSSFSCLFSWFLPFFFFLFFLVPLVLFSRCRSPLRNIPFLAHIIFSNVFPPYLPFSSASCCPYSLFLFFSYPHASLLLTISSIYPILRNPSIPTDQDPSWPALIS